jgi:hypothetical protein
MAQIFISYSSTDRELVARIAEDLRNAQHEVWFDRWRITGRQPYWDEIQSGIENCSHFLFFVSPESISKGSGARKELFHVASLKPTPTLVPVMVRPTPFEDFPIVITPGEYQIHDFATLPYETAFESVLRALDPQRSRMLQPVTRNKRPEVTVTPMVPSPIPASESASSTIAVGSAKTTLASTPTQAIAAPPAKGSNRLPLIIGGALLAVVGIGAFIASQSGADTTPTATSPSVAQIATSTDTPAPTATITLTFSAEEIAATQRSGRRTQTAVAQAATDVQATIDAIISVRDQSDTATAIALTPHTATPTKTRTPVPTHTPTASATFTASATVTATATPTTPPPTPTLPPATTAVPQPVAMGVPNFGGTGEVMVADGTQFLLGMVGEQSGDTIQLSDMAPYLGYRNRSGGVSAGAWSPGGTSFAFTSNREGWWNLYVVNTLGGSPQKLSFLDADTGNTGQPCAGFSWSPFNDRIVYVASDGFMYMVQVNSKVSRDVGLVTRANPRRVGCPSWSPDGNLIYFQSTVRGFINIGVADIRTDKVTLTLGEPPEETDEVAPLVSPTGEWIAYAADSGGEWYLNVMKADGTERRTVHNIEGVLEYPVGWTPDGKGILFTVVEPEQPAKVYVIDIDGSGRRLLAGNAYAVYVRPG